VKAKGLVEFCRIQKFNPSFSLDFGYFANRFARLMFSQHIKTDQFYPKEAVIKLMQQSGIRHFRTGASKLFLSQEDLDVLEANQRALPAPSNVIKINTDNVEQSEFDQTIANFNHLDNNFTTPNVNDKNARAGQNRNR
jgi:hypothetical protein